MSGPLAHVVGARPNFMKASPVIRALQRDYSPDELAGGATLFHEHLHLPPEFSGRFTAAAAAARALYAGMGFAAHHAYHHYRAPDGAAAAGNRSS